MVDIPIIPTKPDTTCKLGYYPVVVLATKGGKPLSGATVKFESWAQVFGRKIGPQTLHRTTDKSGISHVCFLRYMYGTISIRQTNIDFGNGKGKWFTFVNISSLRRPKKFTVKAKVTVPKIVKPIKPTVPTIPTIPGIPEIPIIPVPVIPTPTPTPTPPSVPEVPAGLPSGRVGAVVRLTMRNYMDDRPTLVGGAYWGCKGTSRGYKTEKYAASIAHLTPTSNNIELQRSIDVGETRSFRNGMSVKVVNVIMGYPTARADVIITKTPAYRPPTPPTPTPPVPPVVEKTYTRITRILAEGQDLPKANNGEIVKITAESYCKVNGKIDKSKVPSLLIIDGVVADRKPVVDGVVAYEWSATSIPSRHTICVQINPTDTCRSIGRDCKKISVSSVMLDPSEQLLRERTSAKEQRELMRQSRSRLREEIVGAIREAPVYEAPTVPTPTLPIVIPIEKPPAPQTGNIKLTGLPLSIPKDIPAYIYVDNINKGTVSILPVTLSLIPVGTHSVYVMAGEFKSISKSVDVISNETSTVSLL